MKPNREEVMQALACCSDPECPCQKCTFYGKCYDGMVCEQALIIIKDLTEENNKLSECLSDLFSTNSRIWDKCKKVSEENRLLKEKTVKKMIGMLKEAISQSHIFDTCYISTPRELNNLIDKVAEKVLED